MSLDPIVVEPYDPECPALFEQERGPLEAAIGPSLVRLRALQQGIVWSTQERSRVALVGDVRCAYRRDRKCEPRSRASSPSSGVTRIGRRSETALLSELEPPVHEFSGVSVEAVLHPPTSQSISSLLHNSPS